MRVKLDENLPRRVAPLLTDAGHDVDSVHDEGLAGAPDPEVAAAATAADRLVITLDRGFGDIQRYPPGSHGGILVLRLDDHSAASVHRAIGEVAASIEIDDLRGCVAVWRDGMLRIRRPPVT